MGDAARHGDVTPCSRRARRTSRLRQREGTRTRAVGWSRRTTRTRCRGDTCGEGALSPAARSSVARRSSCGSTQPAFAQAASRDAASAPVEDDGRCAPPIDSASSGSRGGPAFARDSAGDRRPRFVEVSCHTRSARCTAEEHPFANDDAGRGSSARHAIAHDGSGDRPESCVDAGRDRVAPPFFEFGFARNARTGGGYQRLRRQDPRPWSDQKGRSSRGGSFAAKRACERSCERLVRTLPYLACARLRAARIGTPGRGAARSM